MARSNKGKPKKTKRPTTKPAANASPHDPNEKKKKIPRLNLRTVMRPKGIPDTDRLAAITGGVTPKKPVLGGRDSSSFASVVPKTPAQEIAEIAGAEFQELWNENEGKNDFKLAIVSMFTVRRLYIVLMRYMRELLAKKDAERPDNPMPPEVLDFAVQYAMTMSSKPFDETALMDGVLEVMLPFVGGVVDSHISEEAKTRREEIIAANEARAKRPVPIGFKATPTDESPALVRDKALVLIGWKPALRWLLDQATSNVLKDNEEQTYNVVRLMTDAPKRGDQHSHLIRLGSSAWTGCSNTDHAIDKMTMEFVEPTADGPIDLVIADDLPLCFTSGFIGRSPPANAGDAQRRMMKWCERMGSALLGAIPLEGKEFPDFGGPEFEQVKTFTTLRAVTVHDGAQFDKADHYRIVVGNHASVFDVPKDQIDSLGRPTLIVPGGVEA